MACAAVLLVAFGLASFMVWAAFAGDVPVWAAAAHAAHAGTLAWRVCSRYFAAEGSRAIALYAGEDRRNEPWSVRGPGSLLIFPSSEDPRRARSAARSSFSGSARFPSSFRGWPRISRAEPHFVQVSDPLRLWSARRRPVPVIRRSWRAMERASPRLRSASEPLPRGDVYFSCFFRLSPEKAAQHPTDRAP